MSAIAKMTDLEVQLYHDLERCHQGRANTIKGEILAERYGVDKRAIAAAAKRLVEVFHIPVAAYRTTPKGYCIVTESGDAQEFVQMLEDTWRSTYRHRREFQEAFRRLEQGRLL